MRSLHATRPALSFAPGSRQSIYMRHEEKQESVARFCGYFYDRLSVQEHPTAAERHITLLARSPHSPVARALLDTSSEIAALGITLQALFARIEPSEALSAWLDLADTSTAPSHLALRWAQHPALIDAHEQLVLGTSLSWVGDCMRREPEKRDAYEQYDTFDATAAALAQASFNYFWLKSSPLPSRRNSVPAAMSMVEAVHGALANAPLQPLASTRH